MARHDMRTQDKLREFFSSIKDGIAGRGFEGRSFQCAVVELADYTLCNAVR